MTRVLQPGSKDFVGALSPGAVAIVRDEDGTNLDATLAHARKIGFPNIFLLSPKPTTSEADFAMEVPPSADLNDIINPLIDALAGRWLYIGQNAEYLFFPFCEGRSIEDATQFVDEERREAVFCTTVDLYPDLIDRDGTEYSHETAHFDAHGYFSRNRYDGPDKLERQIDLFGGLKWRYAEHIEWTRQRIDRIAMFKAKTGLRLDEKGLLNDSEMNTISCPWHHNMTFCMASFRVAKSLLNNPGSAYEVESFIWKGSQRFGWTSEELMVAGLMEPGQWF